MVFQITVLDFIYNKNNNKAVSRYAMRTPDGDKLSNALNIIFIELPKAKLLEQNLDENTLLENWAIFLKPREKGFNPKTYGQGGWTYAGTEITFINQCKP